MTNKSIKKIVFSFDLLLNIVLILALFFIGFYFLWTKNYNQQFDSLPKTPQRHIRYLNWKYLYPVSFSLIYFSLFLIYVTKFFILISNKNGFLKSFFAIFFINKLQLYNKNPKINKKNSIAFLSS
ncbi:hypothetical protein [Metamycoplasma alkalescens]|uniref:Uncharacterized protein n=2 Tax=Metamycoplasma alkalescens TaxID=45363 RepID=N9U9N5_9BACT|nr:hypothetical protein [Metamycoplasma alkalescens]ENY53638.1 Hypothetical protein, predicted transmembrane protein [Metamycoplasma alkalescens 14918]PYF43135.1 hypothetical protein BCF88_10560 [Metamycoplasma alkalescens]